MPAVPSQLRTHRGAINDVASAACGLHSERANEKTAGGAPRRQQAGRAHGRPGWVGNAHGGGDACNACSATSMSSWSPKVHQPSLPNPAHVHPRLQPSAPGRGSLPCKLTLPSWMLPNTRATSCPSGASAEGCSRQRHLMEAGGGGHLANCRRHGPWLPSAPACVYSSTAALICAAAVQAWHPHRAWPSPGCWCQTR